MQTFIITLVNNEWSSYLASSCIQQAEKFNIQAKVFEAIVGDTYQEHLNNNKLFLHPERGSVYFSSGTYGCFLSHFYLWNKCIDLNAPVIVLEHDGFFIRNLPEDILFKFEDVLKLDCYNPYDSAYDAKISSSINNSLSFTNNIKGIYNQRGFGWYTWGAYAYIIKPSGAKKLVDYSKTYGFSSADNMLGDRVVSITLPSSPIARLHPVFNGDNIKKLSTIK
jgi:glycosyl transferase family 25